MTQDTRPSATEFRLDEGPEIGVPTGPAAAALAAAALLAACGGGGGTETAPATSTGTGATTGATSALVTTPATLADAARFLSQASFGPRTAEELDALRRNGFDAWLQQQFNAPVDSHLDYLAQQRSRNEENRATEEMSYEAVWQQWLWGSGVLRARMSWALLQIFVISNIAPDIRPHAMSSYMDMLNRNAFGNFRQLLEEVTLHPAMGYYLNMLESGKEDPATGSHPNENYAREVLQLFAIGLVQLNPDGTPKLGADGKATPAYDEAVVKGFARAFSGWGFGGLDNRQANSFHDHDDNDEALWVQPMHPWAMFHDTGSKTLLGGRVLPAGQTPQQDMKDALDNIFQHPNVGPFIARQLIQRLVTSNPGPAHVQRVAATFADNGAGVRGDLRAVLRAVLLDPESRSDGTQRLGGGKQREPVLRFAQLLRALGVHSDNGLNPIHYLDGADDALGQSPLLAPSVFNFYSPFFKPAGPVADAGLVAPEFQITTETTVVGSLNFFASVINNAGYGWDASRLQLDYAPLLPLAAGDGAALVERLNLLLFDLQMGASTRARLLALLKALPGASTYEREQRVRAALLLSVMSPDHVIQH
jgi:uncharacterized protein (DUF1800 family)